MSEKLAMNREPCASCPYRRDTPPGIWDASEYRKLPAWDTQWGGNGVFLCHHTPLIDRKTVCRGWIVVHGNNLQARMTAMGGVELTEENVKPTQAPLYDSGSQACRAGLRGVSRPKPEAKAVIQKLTKARKNLPAALAPVPSQHVPRP